MVMRQHIAGICRTGHGYEIAYSWDMPETYSWDMSDGSVQDMVMRQHIAGICWTTLSGTWLWESI